MSAKYTGLSHPRQFTSTASGDANMCSCHDSSDTIGSGPGLVHRSSSVGCFLNPSVPSNPASSSLRERGWGGGLSVSDWIRETMSATSTTGFQYNDDIGPSPRSTPLMPLQSEFEPPLSHHSSPSKFSHAPSRSSMSSQRTFRDVNSELDMRIAQLEQERLSLLRQNLEVNAKLEGMTHAYTRLLEHVGRGAAVIGAHTIPSSVQTSATASDHGATSTIGGVHPDSSRPLHPLSKLPLLPPLQHLDYPNVKYWFVADWRRRPKDGAMKLTSTSKSVRGNLRALNDENLHHRFLEYEDGTVVGGRRLLSMLQDSRGLFEMIFDAGLSPKTWKSAREDVQDFYFTSMGRSFPELRLCADNWKANKLATVVYSKWKQRKQRRQRKVAAAAAETTSCIEEEQSEDSDGVGSTVYDAAEVVDLPDVVLPPNETVPIIKSPVMASSEPTLRMQAKRPAESDLGDLAVVVKPKRPRVAIPSPIVLGKGKFTSVFTPAVHSTPLVTVSDAPAIVLSTAPGSDGNTSTTVITVPSNIPAHVLATFTSTSSLSAAAPTILVNAASSDVATPTMLTSTGSSSTAAPTVLVNTGLSRAAASTIPASMGFSESSAAAPTMLTSVDLSSTGTPNLLVSTNSSSVVTLTTLASTGSSSAAIPTTLTSTSSSSTATTATMLVSVDESSAVRPGPSVGMDSIITLANTGSSSTITATTLAGMDSSSAATPGVPGAAAGPLASVSSSSAVAPTSLTSIIYVNTPSPSASMTLSVPSADDSLDKSTVAASTRGRGRGRAGGTRGRGGATRGPVTARALCKIDYVSKHPSATATAYSAYWKSLKGTEEERLWLKRAYDARTAQEQAAT
ncbi:hypothetical protein FISHEDRAFT_78995 [Fistulina hepatica ATCC 64428]|uniref:Uncharacterized protein n=1 Tax=Fistulina hepatica ATCC 64428 TaxID=1128425 RepID=A0A0D7A0L5_9AGAR|nr:hypothetical protein FISHEDRAFT_78995 [Fistulina hepatica ATCC 64428]